MGSRNFGLATRARRASLLPGPAHPGLSRPPTDAGGEGFEHAHHSSPSRRLHGHSLQGTPLGSRSPLGAASADWGGRWGHSPSMELQGAPDLGKVSPTQRGLLSQLGLAFPTEQDVGLHWRGGRSWVGTGGSGRRRGCCQGELLPARTVDDES